MKITLYVSWYDKSILTEEEFDEKIEEKTNEDFEDSDYFNSWLESNFEPFEIFDFTEEDKAEHRKEFRQYCFKEAKDALSYDYEVITKEA